MSSPFGANGRDRRARGILDGHAATPRAASARAKTAMPCAFPRSPRSAPGRPPPAHASQVRPPARGAAPVRHRIAVVDRASERSRSAAHERSQEPRRTGKRATRRVRRAGSRSAERARLRAGAAAPAGRHGRVGHPRGRSLRGDQVALCRELGIGVDPPHPWTPLARGRASARRQGHSRRQAAAAHRLTQICLLQLSAQRPDPRVQAQHQLRSALSCQGGKTGLPIGQRNHTLVAVPEPSTLRLSAPPARPPVAHPGPIGVLINRRSRRPRAGLASWSAWRRPASCT